MKFTRPIFVAVGILPIAMMIWAAVPTTINDFFLPGSQPNESGNIRTSADCNCHEGYDEDVEPMYNWRGSMMAQAARDPLFYACMTIANQDAPASGDLCIRCHTPKGWLEGRSTPTDGSALTADDRDGVNCHFCHKLVTPTELGVNPYPGDAFYTANTYSADQSYLGTITAIPAHNANGMFVVDSEDVRRGPYSDPSAPHDTYYSPFHKSSNLCGTCHNVSNPAFTKQPGGSYAPNSFDSAAPDFNPHSMFPLERTFSEWQVSAYNTTEGVYAPQFGGNLDTVRTCQDCHMRDVTGAGCKKGSAPIRSDLGLHDLTGGNVFMPLLIAQQYAGEVDTAALNAGVARATYMLQNAASLQASAMQQADSHLATVTVTNETGHKLPSGYPEGRRIWLNVRAYNISDLLIWESGAYDTATGVLTHDTDAKVYEMKLGISNSLSGTVGLPAGPSFHFVLNDSVYKDNRIPPRGFTNAKFDSIQSGAIGYSYPDSQYWDETEYLIPGAAAKVIVTLYYQTTSKEYVEFLRDENVTDSSGIILYNLWNTNGKSAPVVMNSDTLLLTPIAGNQAPVLAAIGNKSVDEGQLLQFDVDAIDADGDSIILYTTALPSGATFNDHFNDSGSFSWTPDYTQSGSYPITFYAADDSGAVDSELITVTVNNVNQPPVLDSIGNKSVNEGQLLQFTVSSSDFDGDSIALSTSTLPAGAIFTDHFNDTATFSWTPDYTQSGNYPLTYYATDDSGAVDSEVITITVNNINDSPVLDSIGNRTVNEEQLLQFTVSASDINGDSIILATSTLPSGASFNDNFNDSGSFSWTPDYSQSGSYPLTFYASDTSGGIDSEVITITVNNINDPPVLDSIGNRAVNESQLLQFTVSASDINGDSIILATSTLPGGASFNDNFNDSGSFSWTPDYTQSGNYPITFYATDASDAVDSEVITITVNNVDRPPVLNAIGSPSVAEGDTLEIIVSGSDPDNDSLILTTGTLPLNATFEDNFDGTGLFRFIPDYDQSGNYDVTFVISDGLLADSEEVTITVTNTNRAPTVSSVGAQFVVAGELLTFDVFATDPDGDPLTLDAVSLPGTSSFSDHGNDSGTFEWTPAEVDTGSYSIEFFATDGNLSDTISVDVTVQPPGGCCIGLRGDCNNDGVDANILDLNFLVNRIFRFGPPPVCPEEADVNIDGNSGNILDLNFLINRIFRFGPAPGPC